MLKMRHDSCHKDASLAQGSPRHKVPRGTRFPAAQGSPRHKVPRGTRFLAAQGSRSVSDWMVHNEAGALCHGPCVMGLVSWALCHGPCAMGLVPWALCHGPCAMGLVSWALCHGPCVMGLVSWALCHGPCVMGLVSWALCHGPCDKAVSKTHKSSNGLLGPCLRFNFRAYRDDVFEEMSV
jgi:hypothetical protein